MKVIVRWSAYYETELTVPDGATEEEIRDAAADIWLDVPGSEYQQDTWDVESITKVE